VIKKKLWVVKKKPWVIKNKYWVVNDLISNTIASKEIGSYHDKLEWLINKDDKFYLGRNALWSFIYP
jgi:hypothetical protein